LTLAAARAYDSATFLGARTAMNHRITAFSMLLVALCACTDTTPRTQVMLEVDADAEVRGRLATLRVLVDVSDDDGKSWHHKLTESFDAERVGGWDDFAWPARLGFTPEGGKTGRRVDVRVQALDDGGKLFVWQSAVAGFTKQHTTVLRMTLSAACVDSSCGEPSCVGEKGCQTCNAGQCDDVTLMTLKDFDPDAPRGDAGGEAGIDADGGPGDAGEGTDGGAGGDREGGMKPRGDAGKDTGKDTGIDSEPEPAKYHVVSSSPDDDDPVITDDDGVVQVKFSAPVDPESVTWESFIVSRNGTGLDGEFTIGKSTVTFTPDDPWVLGGRYHLELTDAIEDADGKPLDPYEVDFQFRDGEWTKEARVMTNVQRALIAAAPGGDAVLAVARLGETAYDVAARRFLAPDTWEAELSVTTQVTELTLAAINDKHHPLVAVNSISANFSASTYLEGPGWEYAGGVMLGGYDPGWSLDPRKDDLYAVAASGSDNRLKGLHFTLGAVGPIAVDVGDATGQDASPRVALVDGVARVVWLRRADGSSPRHVVAGTFDEMIPTTLSDEAVDAEPATLVANQRGSAAVVVWEQSDAVWHNVWASRLTAGGAWSTAVRVSDDAAAAITPKVAIDDQGRALAVWEQDDEIYAASFTPKGGWAEPAPISDDAMMPEPPQVALEPGGNGLAAWPQDGTESFTNEIWAARYIAGKGWQAPVRVSDPEASTNSDISLAIDNRGRAFVTWVAGNAAWVARFE
jgi:hypothetical protein